MSEDFIGYKEAIHVAQPADTELCFAACVVSVANGIVEDAHRNLQAAFISESDGTTAPPWSDTVIPWLGGGLEIQVIQAPTTPALTGTELIAAIDGSLQAEVPVALLYKKTADPDDEQYHWVVITGYEQTETGVKGVEIMDPLRQALELADPLEVLAMIERSLPTGIFAYGLNFQPAV